VAIVSVPDLGIVLSETGEVQKYLAGIGLDYEIWPVLDLPADASAETILNSYRQDIERIKVLGGYTSVDVVNVYSRTPGLDEMLARFNREHWHDEDEVRFTVAGSGMFHIHPKNRAVVAVEVLPGDLIRVPRGTHHWFNLCRSREIKVIRFFQDKSGWTPHYTDAATAEKYEPVCFGPAYFLGFDDRIQK
jgi:1,2-dihydroxy-3-keto-5-methylthiopentene dioxygenase